MSPHASTRFAWLLGLCTACGRIDFDALADAPADAATGHDEDGDGIADGRDPCPHVVGNTEDRDGDGVGDACDPRPEAPTESWLRFYSLVPGDVPFALGSSTQEDDAVRVTRTDAAGKRVAVAVTTVRIDLGFEILEVLGTGQHSIASGIDRGVEPYYFVEITDFNNNQTVEIVSYTNPSYTSLANEPHDGVHPGLGFLRYDATAGVNPMFAAEAGWIGELYRPAAPTPSYAGGSTIRIDLAGIDVRFRYLALIAGP